MRVTMTGFEYEVSWGDFSRVAERPNQVDEDAQVRARTRVNYDSEGGGGNWRVTEARGNVAVNQADSWVVQGRETDALLRHEQGHFDITALGAREEENLVGAITGNSQNNIEAQRVQIRQQVQARVNNANVRYDTRTDHSQNAAAQQRWLRSIRAAKDSDAGTVDDLPD